MKKSELARVVESRIKKIKNDKNLNQLEKLIAIRDYLESIKK